MADLGTRPDATSEGRRRSDGLIYLAFRFAKPRGGSGEI